MAAAALAFAVTHSTELFAYGLIEQRSGRIDPTVFITLGLFAATEWVVFVVVGTPIAYYPSRAIYKVSIKWKSETYFLCMLASISLAVMALPLCAGVSFIASPDADAPSYLNRCLEYLFPMAVAGALGGHVFWRRIGHSVANRPLADHFS